MSSGEHQKGTILDDDSQNQTKFHLTTNELYNPEQSINNASLLLILSLRIKDSIPVSAKQLEIIERKKHRHNLQREIITIAKKIIKPAYKNRRITKDNYKIIMKKVVTKATYSNKVDEKWITKMINSYVRKYQKI